MLRKYHPGALAGDTVNRRSPEQNQWIDDDRRGPPGGRVPSPPRAATSPNGEWGLNADTGEYMAPRRW